MPELPEGFVSEQVSADAVFFVDSRQFDLTTFRYDARIANASLFFGYHEAVQPIEETQALTGAR